MNKNEWLSTLYYEIGLCLTNEMRVTHSTLSSNGGKIFSKWVYALDIIGTNEKFSHRTILKNEIVLDIENRNTNIRLLTKADKNKYNFINIPIWAMEKDGYLFVRVYCPRINYGYVDIIKDGKHQEICPEDKNVKDFIDDFD